MSNTEDISRQSRIPFTLQAVFLASNRGKDVHKPPPRNAANKVFKRNWLLQRQSKEKAPVKKEGDTAAAHENKKFKHKADDQGVCEMVLFKLYCNIIAQLLPRGRIISPSHLLFKHQAG